MLVLAKQRRLCIFSRMVLCTFLMASLVTTGCASKYGTQKTVVNHYPDCYQPINELRKSEFAVAKSVAGGAVAGAALGALIGYLATGKASGAVVGAAAGGIAGGTAGGVYGQSQKDANDEARLAQYNSQLDGGIREVDKATAAARVARQCYERQFTVAASEYKAKRLTKEQFNSRYQEVSSGMQEAAEILGEANRNSSEVVAQYNQAIGQEKQRVAKSSSSAKAKETQQVAQMQSKTSTMQKSVSAGQTEERLMRERLSAMQKQAQDLMS